MKSKYGVLIKDIVLFIISLSIAWWIIKNPYFELILEGILPLRFVAEFIAGMMFASFLTTPISIASFIVIGEHTNPILASLVGGLGATFSDYIIVRFFRKKAVEDLNLVTDNLRLDLISKFLKKMHLEFLITVLGLIIIASPFPDELGLVLLSNSRFDNKHLFLLIFLLNTLGIMLIVLPVNLIS